MLELRDVCQVCGIRSGEEGELADIGMGPVRVRWSKHDKHDLCGECRRYLTRGYSMVSRGDWPVPELPPPPPGERRPRRPREADLCPGAPDGFGKGRPHAVMSAEGIVPYCVNCELDFP